MKCYGIKHGFDKNYENVKNEIVHGNKQQRKDIILANNEDFRSEGADKVVELEVKDL